jgi:RNA polymerase sigma factor (sigma-70 family)
MADPAASRETRPSLLVRIRDPRDCAAWQTFVEIYAPLIYGFARRRGLQDADAADVGQEVLAEVARCIRSFEYRPELGRFRDWLGVLVRRQIHRFRDRQRAAPVGAAAGAETPGDRPQDPQSPPVDPEWSDAFKATILYVALERVRPHFETATWRAFECVWLNHQPAAEAAAQLDVAIETVYVAKSRVLKRLEEEVRLLAEDVPHCVLDN